LISGALRKIGSAPKRDLRSLKEKQFAKDCFREKGRNQLTLLKYYFRDFIQCRILDRFPEFAMKQTNPPLKLGEPSNLLHLSYIAQLLRQYIDQRGLRKAL
jgi:hypothetical protein